MTKFFKLTTLLIALIFAPSIYAHSLLLNVFDNEDNTITVEGIFNTGESGAGALIQLESIASGVILYEKRLSDDSELTFKIPSEAYKIILDGGPGHKVVKNGIPPKDGFVAQTENVENVPKVKKANKENKKAGKLSMQTSSSTAVNVSILLAFILLFATLFISIRNSNAILKELRN